MIAYIAIGSNLGDRIANVKKAVLRAADEVKATLVLLSSFYETEPWGMKEQGAFVNAVMGVETELTPAALLAHLKSVEAGMGRQETERWGPRTIDLDIIFYGDLVVGEDGLTIPHPSAHERAFVMVPLAEIAPEFKHPVLGRTVSEIAGSLDKTGVRKMEP
ncbi:MAG: 2-amino-4-hydroxy-6-hydroxymethyldihydropteridine diphosphokinase [Deltaproteobacteria bacterium]|nr:2-amino-4-hydroxy-6-hydroxymethyldihydropteridine diphosphokinase [Deltaproteobacteria bacterium]